MKICLIGGIYGQDGTPSSYLRVTPETTLESGLRHAGHQVTTLSHYHATDFARFDVVHVHHLSYGAARLGSDLSPAPFVFTPHDTSEMSGAGLGAARSLALKFVLSRADRVVSLSRAEARFQQSAHRIEAARVATIPNGIDDRLYPFKRENAAGRNQPWKLLFVGQLIPLKGCDLILRALAAVKENVELTIVYQSASLETELRSLALQLGLEHRVHFLGRQEPTRLAELYRRSDLLVMASRTEALPSVLTEAMCNGLPFISTDVGGIREQTAGFGHLLADRSVDALTIGIYHVLSEYGQYAATAEMMSRHARRTYSVQAMIDGHLALYESIAGRPTRRANWRYSALNAAVRAGVKWRGSRPPTKTSSIELPEPSSATE